MRLLCCLVLGWLLVALVGCSSRGNPSGVSEDHSTRLSDQSSVDVRSWLSQPRAELAQKAENYRQMVRGIVERHRLAPAIVSLLPRLRIPIRWAVFEQSSYRADRGFSLPDYVQGGHDRGVADHLARYRDLDAATKLGATVTTGRTYPHEWTQAVAGAISEAELRLTSGDYQAAADLIFVHKELLDILDDEAKKSDLGRLLLSEGKRALSQAARAWRDPHHNQTALAADVEDALARWGDVVSPPTFPALQRDQLSAVWGGPVAGPAAVAVKSACTRVLDLLGPLVPSEGVIAVGAFLDNAGRLAEIQVAYRSGLDTLYPEPTDLAYRLIERGLTPEKEEKTGGHQRQLFRESRLSCDVVRTNRSQAIGAIVRLVPTTHDLSTPVTLSRDVRDFGPVHLDRLYESSRLRLDPQLVGPPLVVLHKHTLQRLVAGLQVPLPMSANVERDGLLISSVSLIWTGNTGVAETAEVLAGLWSAYASPQVTQIADGASSALVLAWMVGDTRLELRLPFDNQPTMLIARVTGLKTDESQRVKAAIERDRDERAKRIENGQADKRLTPGPAEVNRILLPQLRLGATRQEVESALPTGKDYRRQDLVDGVSVLIDSSDAKAPFWAKQLLVRYSGEKVTEIRVRYVELDGLQHYKTLLADPKIGPGDEQPCEWASLWNDLPSERMKKWVWRDDFTERTYRRYAGASEVVWRVVDQPSTLWRFVSLGPQSGLGVGSSRSDFVASWGPPVATQDGAVVFRQATNSPYGMVLVWFDGAKAYRLAAVHRVKPVSEEPEAVNAALMRVWARDLDGLGYLRRQESRRADRLGGMYWHDDVTRVYAFVQNTPEGLRLITEWQDWSRLR